jgi:hypothetical protein
VELLRWGPQTADERRLLLVTHAQEVQAHIAEFQQDLEVIARKIASYETFGQDL